MSSFNQVFLGRLRPNIDNQPSPIASSINNNNLLLLYKKSLHKINLTSSIQSQININDNLFEALFVGDSCFFAIDAENQLFSWGDNDSYQLGLSVDGTIDVPTRVLFNESGSGKFFENRIISVSCGKNFSIALSKSGACWSFGINSMGQLGRPSKSTISKTPTRISFLTGLAFKKIATGMSHVLALTENGSVFSWGSNEFGQLGQRGEYKFVGEPKLISVDNVIDIACGSFHSVLLTCDGRVRTFGLGSSGQLGHNSKNNESFPKIVIDLLGDEIESIACTSKQTFVLKKNRRLYAFGERISSFGIDFFAVDNNSTNIEQSQQQTVTPTHIPVDFTDFENVHLSCFHDSEFLVVDNILLESPKIETLSLDLIKDLVEEIENSKDCVVIKIKELQKLVGSVLSSASSVNASFGEKTKFDAFATSEIFHLLSKLEPKIESLNILGYELQSMSRVIQNAINFSIKELDSVFSDPSKNVVGSFPNLFSCKYLVVISFLPKNILDGCLPFLCAVLIKFEDEIWDVIKASWQKMAIFPFEVTSSPYTDSIKTAFAKFLSSLHDLINFSVKKRKYDSTLYVKILERFYNINNIGWSKGNGHSISCLDQFKVGEKIKLTNSNLKQKYHSLPTPERIVDHSLFYNSAVSQYLDVGKAYWHIMSSNMTSEFKIVSDQPNSAGIPHGAEITFGFRDPDLLDPVHQHPIPTNTATPLLPSMRSGNIPTNMLRLPGDSIASTLHEILQMVAEDPNQQSTQNVSTQTPTTTTHVRSRSSLLKTALSFFPFTFDLPLKLKLLDIDSQRQQAQERGLSLVRNMVLHLANVESPFLEVKVKRDHLYEDAVEFFGADLIESVAVEAKKDLPFKKPMKITFEGEDGVDEGGVSNEFINLFFEDVLKRQFFVSEESFNDFQMWINPGSSASLLLEYQVIGRVLGLAVYNSCLCSLQFSQIIFKRLLDWPVGSDDLTTLRPNIARGLKEILEYEGEDLEIFGLDFTATVELTNGDITSSLVSRKSVELKEGGDGLMLTKSNRDEYVKLYTEWILKENVKLKMEAFKKGFFEVCDGPIFKMLTPKDIELLICGSPSIDFNDWENYTRYDPPFTKDHKVIVLFWSVFHELSDIHKKMFLRFVTGSNRVPLQGIKAIRFSIQPCGGEEEAVEDETIDDVVDVTEMVDISPVALGKRKREDSVDDGDEAGGEKRVKVENVDGGCSSWTEPKRCKIWRLPSSHTCANVLDLPYYPSKSILKERLIYSIENCQNFGLV